MARIAGQLTPPLILQWMSARAGARGGEMP
jgi:hypothetical protein